MSDVDEVLLEESGAENDLDASLENDDAEDDPELEAIKERVKAMEAEAEKLKELQSEVESQMSMGDAPMGSANFPTLEEKVDADNRSIYIGQVDYSATAEELEQHFHGCGALNRVTILCDKYSGHPKGFAYIEFTEKESVDAAIALDGSMFRGRQIKVMPKRTNKPGVSSTDRGGFRGRGRGRGRGFYGRGRGRAMYRGRGRGGYAPY
ncbi:Oidioi.mRNA.OKI2018_I69.chr1.g2350.t1.cds [Oikopleura dioica]|uniref:Oidioi.mRNA.OKI2018_I69.chr1.g2350.t1.cds n=1 Tax=Oikopleura dioica TaxID=34765 RepID=A0ABN7SV45_OIKDI|nr:Oidioi.mRNA.OKI2018_I69.chr1.g2350.t1.cds [Oikopleura dioica]